MMFKLLEANNESSSPLTCFNSDHAHFPPKGCYAELPLPHYTRGRKFSGREQDLVEKTGASGGLLVAA